jgi:hypothetical protein
MTVPPEEKGEERSSFALLPRLYPYLVAWITWRSVGPLGVPLVQYG